MPIITLLNRVKDQIDHPPHPMLARELSLRHCYLTGLAMQAHSDGDLVDEERVHFLEMAKLFEVSESDAEQLLVDAKSPDEMMVKEIRRCMMHSKYKYYFLLDLQIMAHQDSEIKQVETQVVRRFAEILEIDGQDMDFLVELADAVACNDPQAKANWCASFFNRQTLAQEADPKDFKHYTS